MASWKKGYVKKDYTAINAARAASFMAATPGLAEAFALAEGRTGKAAEILRDMKERVAKWGSMTPKAVDFAFSLAADFFCPEKPADEKAPAPTGRIEFTGKVISIKTHMGDYGESVKMTVKVPTPEGPCWLAWGTCSSSLMNDDVAVGDTVTLTATCKAGRDPYFALFSRPANARIVERKAAPETEAA